MGRVMARYCLILSDALPYFAEVPYYVWGQVNYDSEGDCRVPTDRRWTWLELENRKTRERLSIRRDGESVIVEGDDPAAARAARFLQARCGGGAADPVQAGVGNWSEDGDHLRGMARAARVAREFANPVLGMFDSHLFWGSWKWIGWFGSELTWVGRWIMHATTRGDKRAVKLCIDWLRAGTFSSAQSDALRGAVAHLTGVSFADDATAIAWCDREGIEDPDLDAWYAELKAEYEAEMVLA
jgi:hypothetical protein